MFFTTAKSSGRSYRKSIENDRFGQLTKTIN